MIKDILATKGSHVFTIHPLASVLEAARLMNEHSIGGLVVLKDNQVHGIVTERDVLRKVVAVERQPSQVTIEQIMSTDVVCCQATTTIEEARSVFKNHRIRHLPVIDEQNRLQGMISIGDLNAHHSNAQETTILYLKQYLYGQTTL